MIGGWCAGIAWVSVRGSHAYLFFFFAPSLPGDLIDPNSYQRSIPLGAGLVIDDVSFANRSFPARA